VSSLDMPLFALFKHCGNVLFRVADVFDTHYTTEEDVCLSVGLRGRDDTGAINQEDSSHERDVLPDLSLSRNRSDSADLLGAEGVDDGGFAGVGVSDQSDGDLLPIGVEGRELAEELDKRAF